MKKRVLNIFLLFIAFHLFALSNLYADEEAGRVLAIKKKVVRIRENIAENAEPQMQLLKKDAVETDIKSRTKLFFTDDSILNLGELSRVEVEEYLYSSEKDRSKSVYKLMDGYMKVIVGRSDLEIHTPTAVASARGTKFIVSVEGICKGNEAKIDKALCAQKFTRIIVLEGKVETWNIAPGVKGSVVVNQGQMNKVPAQKPPEAVKPLDMKVMEQFVENTVVISDAAVAREILPTLMVDETKQEKTQAGKESGAAQAPAPPPPPPPTVSEIVTQQPTTNAFTPVRININFPE